MPPARGAKALLFIVAALVPAVLSAQSPTTAALEGTVAGPDGSPLSDVGLTLRQVGANTAVLGQTGIEGEFEFPLLPPGRYELLVEQLGYRPVLVGPIPLGLDHRVGIAVELRPAEGVVEEPDRVPFIGAASAGSRAGRSVAFSEWERRAIPYVDGEAGELMMTSTVGEPPLTVEGLPATLGALTIDGVAFQPLELPALADLGSILVPILGLAQAELFAGRPDVEWPSAAGGILATMLNTGGDRSSGRLEGALGMDPLAIDEVTSSYTTWRGGASFGGALAGDSAHAWFGVQALQREQPVSRVPGWAADLQLGTGDEFGWVATPIKKQHIEAAGTFDWSLPRGRYLRVSAVVADAQDDVPAVAPEGGRIPVARDARDIMTAATMLAPLSDEVSAQFHLGFGNSTRTYEAAGGDTTPFGDAAVVVASVPLQLSGSQALPADLKRSEINGQGTVYFQSGAHRVKLGAGFAARWHDRTELYGRTGSYLFATPADLRNRLGAFQGTAGPVPAATFTTQDFFGYAQDTWQLAPGFDFTTGARVDIETLPASGLLRNRRWFELTGIDNTDISSAATTFGAVAALNWDIENRHEWFIRGGLTLVGGDVSPALLGEALTSNGRISALGAVGNLADTSPRDLGPMLTVLSGDIQPPLTTRGSIGLSRALGASAALHLSGVLRRTENLPRRRDLNLLATAPYADQYDRPVFGSLVRQGSLLAAEPGSNRRFSEFDRVFAVHTDGISTYWGLTAALEKNAGDRVKLTASFTHSATRDEWPGAGMLPGVQELPPFPGVDGLDDWQDGISDLDAPNRAMAAVDVRLPVITGVHFGALYRMASGLPFTPGFGSAVDANGDGVIGNDPAYVDDALPGMDDLLTRWPCLRENAGRFAERNSCRLPTRRSIDAWVTAALPVMEGVRTELRLEGIDLSPRGLGIYDTALYVLDPNGSLTVDPVSGRVHVPLAVNSHFRQGQLTDTQLSRLRISLRLYF